MVCCSYDIRFYKGQYRRPNNETRPHRLNADVFVVVKVGACPYSRALFEKQIDRVHTHETQKNSWRSYKIQHKQIRITKFRLNS